jgi:hypothetical protein
MVDVGFSPVGFAICLAQLNRTSKTPGQLGVCSHTLIPLSETSLPIRFS